MIINSPPFVSEAAEGLCSVPNMADSYLGVVHMDICISTLVTRNNSNSFSNEGRERNFKIFSILFTLL